MVDDCQQIMTVLGAYAQDTCYIMSLGATTKMSDVGDNYPHLLKWFQLYLFKYVSTLLVIKNVI